MHSLCTDLFRCIGSYLTPLDKSVIYFTSKFLRKQMRIRKAVNKQLFVTLAAESGFIALLAWAKQNNCPFQASTCAYAAQKEHFKTLKWLHDNNCPWDEKTFQIVAGYGRQDLAEWLIKEGCPKDSRTLARAVNSGNDDFVYWLYNQGCPGDELVCYSAARNGHLKLLKWAIKLFPSFSMHILCRKAVHDLSVLKWCSSKYHLPRDICNAAAEVGNVEALDFLLGTYAWSSKIVEKAIAFNHVSILEYALQKGYSLPKNALNQALIARSKDVLLWLREYGGYEWNAKMLFDLLENSRPDYHLLYWLRTQGCPYEKEKLLAKLTQNPIPKWFVI